MIFRIVQHKLNCFVKLRSMFCWNNLEPNRGLKDVTILSFCWAILLFTSHTKKGFLNHGYKHYNPIWRLQRRLSSWHDVVIILEWGSLQAVGNCVSSGSSLQTQPRLGVNSWDDAWRTAMCPNILIDGPFGIAFRADHVNANLRIDWGTSGIIRALINWRVNTAIRS